MRADRFPKRLIVGHSRLIERLHVQSDEPLTLLIGDLQVAVCFDQMLEAQLARKAVRPTERLRREPGQVIDVMRPALREQRLHAPDLARGRSAAGTAARCTCVKSDR